MKMKSLATAIALTIVPASSVFAAALDRSGQSIAAFLQPDNYFEVGMSVLDPDVSGKEAGTSATRRSISDMADDYAFGQAAIKVQPTKNFSFGLLYDQPFGADATYSGNNIFVASPTDTILGAEQLAGIRQDQITNNINDRLPGALEANLDAGVDRTVSAQAANAIATNPELAGVPQAVVEAGIRNDPAKMAAITAGVTNAITQQVTDLVTEAVNSGIDDVNGTVGGTGGGTHVEVTTQNLSFLFGFQPNENWNIYAGPVYQTIKGTLKLRGQGYSLYNGYDASIPEDSAWGWLAGVAFQIPEIALKASVTYRSEIDYDTNIRETIPTLGALALLGQDPTAIANAQGLTSITTPKSVNVDFQTGIMADTVAFANLRWVPWSDFSIQPHKFGLLSQAVGPLVGQPNGFNLVEYADDQWSANVGVGRKLNDQWAGNVSVGWDSGAGNPVTTLGPTEGYWNVGFGVQYSPAANYFVAGGLKYFWLGDAKAQTGAQAGTNAFVADFTDNHAIAYGLKLGYRF
ncbi:long-chain fatty acid transporter [Alkanindiges sp. WGS2144]|uniref:long-chain fatty acid transporter n=1 Tax=Alkanindiges sp. WGS2144 TaxID=3366808 RepID=UPI003751D97F